MNNIICKFLLACSVMLSGCSSSERIQEYMARKEESSEMIEIKDITVTEENLTLDYRISNPFQDDIRVCHDTWVYGKQNVQNATTRIDGGTVWIELRFNIEGTFPGFSDPQAIAKYVRLRPGESCSGRIILDLPVRDYSRERREGPKELKQTALHRAVFEIGYIGAFGPKWDKILASWAEKFKRESIEPRPKVSGPLYYLPVNPLITEEELDGRLRGVMYLQEYTSLQKKEESAEVLITDVNIPCSIVVDDERGSADSMQRSAVCLSLYPPPAESYTHTCQSHGAEKFWDMAGAVLLPAGSPNATNAPLSIEPRRLRATKATPVAVLCGMAFVDPPLAADTNRP